MKDGETLKDWVERIAKEHEESGWVFMPFAWYNVDGDQLEVTWSDQRDYVSELKGRVTDKDGKPWLDKNGNNWSVMGLHKDMETDVPTGVTVYSIKHLLREAGFEIVPIKEKE